MLMRGVPKRIRSDYGAEMTAKVVRNWLMQVEPTPCSSNQAAPEHTGYGKSFNGRICDELLNSEIFYSLKEPKTVIEQWRKQDNTIRPNLSLGYRPSAPQTINPARLEAEQMQ